jgi:small subunit ribosomal protein S16
VGSKKNPIWRIVVADGRSPRDGRFIETIGSYNPQTQPSKIVLDKERLQHWLDLGAQPTNTVKKLMRAESDGSNAPAAAIVEEAEAEEAAEPESADKAAAPGEPAPGADGEVPEVKPGEPDAAADVAAEGEAEPSGPTEPPATSG